MTSERRDARESRALTSMKSVFKSLFATTVMLAVMILSFSDSITWQTFNIVSPLRPHVKLTTIVFSPM